MLDQKIPTRPRIALVFGEAGSASHLRDAVSSHVEIVYEATAADFDVSHVAASRATAALVNLDDCESLDVVETRLQDAGVAIVFNDPEISSKLEGWAQARWLRHLTAKLSGSSDFDPPRPVVAQTVPITLDAGSGAQPLQEAAAVAADGAEATPYLVERPLSPAEIESMTADFVAVQEPQGAPADLDATVEGASHPADRGSEESRMPTGAVVEPGIQIETPMPVAKIEAMDAAAMPDSENEHRDHDTLDVDTEALSAMIDARLAAAEGEPAPESPEVWRVVEGGSVSAVELPPVGPEPVAAAPVVATAPIDDADVLKALPSLDDWQLVDHDAPVVSAAVPKQEEQASPTLSVDFAGLELVPMETVVPIELNSEPIERWMHASSEKNGAASGKEKPATANSRGDRA